MENTKKPSKTRERLVKFFGSRAARNTVLIVLMVFSFLCMLMLDDSNYVRNDYLAFLNSNFISELMRVCNIQRFNVTLGAWLLYITFIIAVVAFMFANIFSPKFVDKRAENSKNFATVAGARRFYIAVYYLIVLLILLAVVFVVAMAGGYKDLAMYSDSGKLFLNLIYTILLGVMFAVLIVALVVLLFFVIKFLFFSIAYIVKGVSHFLTEIDEAKEGKTEEEETTENVAGDSVVGDADLNKDLFPALTKIDIQYGAGEEAAEEVVAEENVGATEEVEAPKEEKKATFDMNLEELVLQFQSFAINKHKMYYELPLLRSFIASLATSRMVILEGLSGTGKSMLPRMFAEFTGSRKSFSPVQSTWRDKSDVLGFYSEFSKSFKTTEFLKELYEASYVDKANLMVLDEMNLSRIEYYFADFLSVLEFPEEDWKIKVHETEVGQKLPAKLTDGYITVPHNTWFIGTANTDDSTFVITDKVYDRAMVLDFKERISPITSDYASDPIEITGEELNDLLNEAVNNEDNKLTVDETDKFLKVCDFAREKLEVRFGNRIMEQVYKFVPAYVALGGTKEEALDFIFAHKILRKLETSFEDYIKEEVVNLTKLIDSLYGKGSFKETEKVIAKITKRF